MHRCAGPLLFVPSFTGIPSKKCPGIGFLLIADWKMRSFHMWQHPRGYVSNFLMRLASSRGALGRSGTPSRQSRGIDPPIAIRRGEGAQMMWCREPGCSPRVRPVCRGTLGVPSWVPSTILHFSQNVGLVLRCCSGQGTHLAMKRVSRGFSRVSAGFSRYDGEFWLPLVLAQGRPIFHSSCKGELGMLSSNCRAKETSSRLLSRR